MWSEIGIKQEGNEISREQVENYAQDIANRLHLGEKALEIQEQKLIIDCITGLLNIAVQGMGAGIASGHEMGIKQHRPISCITNFP